MLSPEVSEARSGHRPVVALETSVLAQGLPHPRNVETAEAIASAIRSRGGVPAWTWVAGGEVRVGAEPEDLWRLTSPDVPTSKVARRDLPAAVATGGLGATTVSASLWIASRAGIEVMATGGIGGVHPGTGDVSADLLELARLPGTVVCSGPKSIVDPRATIERLEELGVLIVGYGTDRLPFFLARASDVRLEHRVDSPGAAADISRARAELGVDSAVLLCNPVPDEHALDPRAIQAAVRTCERRAVEAGITGKDVTPFLLACLSRETNGASLASNVALLVANAALAAEVADALEPRR